MGAILPAGVALAIWTAGDGAWILPAMMLLGILGGMAWAAIPAFLQDALERQRDPDQPDADLCRELC